MENITAVIPHGYPIDSGYFGYNYDLKRYSLWSTEEEYLEHVREAREEARKRCI